MSMRPWRGVMTLWMISIVTVAYTDIGPPTIILTDKVVHFSALNGNDVVIEQGTYRVEATKDGLKLTPTVGEKKEAILIHASSITHTEQIETPQAYLKVTGEDEIKLTLVMPAGQGMEATGSQSGVRTRSGQIGALVCCNTAMGEGAFLNKDCCDRASYNTVIGSQALAKNTIGFSNVAVGYQSLFQNLQGNDNTALGTLALGSNESGKENTALGSQALLKIKGANYNTAVGSKALMENLGGNFNTGVGVESLKTNVTGEWNTSIGVQTLFSNTSGRDNTATGTQALFRNTTGNQNTATGVQALHFNTTGSRNTAVGNMALLNNNNGDSNTAVGYGALEKNTTAINNTAVGTWALRENRGIGNTALGSSALERNVAASMNTAIGAGVLAVNEGEANSGIGHHALARNQAGARNTALGSGALFANFNGSNNTAIGHGAGANQTTGSNNTSIGFGAGANQTTGNHNIYIDNPGIQSPIESGTVRIGTAGPHTRVFLAGIAGVPLSGSAVVINAQGQLGIQGSSLRYKENIQDMAENSQDLHKLRPVSFRYKAADGEPANPRAFGLIAEEVAQIYPELVTYSASGEVDSVQYLQLAALLLNELQRQHKTIEAQQARMHSQDQRVEQLLKRMDGLEAKDR